MANQYIRVRYVKSSIGYNQRQKDTVASLGLRKLRQERILPANDAVLGMCKAVQHLVAWEPVELDAAQEAALRAEQARMTPSHKRDGVD